MIGKAKKISVRLYWLRKTVLMLLVILWMSVIFWFSERDGQASTEDSNRARVFVTSLVDLGRSSLGEGLVSLLADSSFPIRKLAHGTEFFVLAFLLVCVLRPRENREQLGKMMLLSFLIAVLYACGDELHQWFVPGRSCELTDVCIDSFGAFLGIMVCGAISLRA